MWYLVEYKCNLINSPISSKDWYYSKIVRAQVLPLTYSLEQYCGEIKNQGSAGLCHSFAGSSVKDIQENIETGFKYNLSPLYLAKKVKSIDSFPDTEGSDLLSVCKALQSEGTIKEMYYPYNQYKAGSLEFPECKYTKIPKYKIKNYARCDTVDSIKQAIYNNKPVLLGIECTNNIYDLDNNSSKFIKMPTGYAIGGHAIVVIGYDDNLVHTYEDGRSFKGFFRIQNSWGTNWGDNGFAWLPYEYLNFKAYIIADNYLSFFNEAWAMVDLENDPINTTTIVMQIDNKTITIDGKSIVTDQAPIIDKTTSRTLVPLRVLSEALGFTVGWDGKTKTITISKELE